MFPFLFGEDQEVMQQGAQDQAQSAAPGAVPQATPAAGAVGAGGGGPIPGGTGTSQTSANPGLQAQWQNYFSHPATMAMMLAAGIEMMKPRWEPSSALPDALSAGVRAGGAYHDDVRAQEMNEIDWQRRTMEQEEKEINATARTRIAADSRAEVAAANNAARDQREILKSELKGGPSNKQETTFWRQQYAAHKRMLEAQNKAANDPINKKLDPTMKALTPQEIDEQAREAADTALAGYKVRFGGGKAENHHGQTPNNITPNGQTPSPGTVPSPGNTGPTAPAKTGATPSTKIYSYAEIEADLGGPEGMKAALADPARAAKIRSLIKPEEEHYLNQGPSGETGDPIKQKYQGYMGR